MLDSSDNTLDYTTEYFFDLVGNRVRKETDTGSDALLDEVISYLYDNNDRLFSEGLDSDANGVANKTTVYEYGTGNAGTQQTKKTVWQGTTVGAGGIKLSETTYAFNLQGRMATAVVDSDGNGTPDSTSTYTYNDQGIRVSQTVDGQTTNYVIDSNNHTGYAQVLEERDASTGAVLKTYTFGHDLIAQQAAAIQAGDTLFLLYDGHGSTRMLVGPTGQAIAGQSFTYDAFGNAHGFDPGAALTTHLYNGETFEIETGFQYLRARYYEPSTGRFNSLDPASGDSDDPITLHKYVYGNANPVLYVDPLGVSGVPGHVYETLGIPVHWMFKIYVYTLGITDKPGKELGTVLPDLFPPGSAGESLKPDVVDVNHRRYFDLKPVTYENRPGKLAEVNVQMTSYDRALQPHSYHRGSSRSIVARDKLPIGWITDGTNWYSVSLWAAKHNLPGGVNGRGIIWYELDKVPRGSVGDNEVDIPSELNVPSRVVQSIRMRPINHGLTPEQLYGTIAATIASATAWATWMVMSAAPVAYDSAIAGTVYANAYMGVAA